MIGAGEAFRKWRGYSMGFTHKSINIAVGMWACGTVLLFERYAFTTIPLNHLSRLACRQAEP
jgi:hypothetical protein